MSRQFEALKSFPPVVPEVSRRKQKLGVLIEKRKEWRQSAAVDRKLESAESGVGSEEAEKAQARRVFLKSGPGERPWRKKLASVARRLP